jgi:hypothetical protein
MRMAVTNICEYATSPCFWHFQVVPTLSGTGTLRMSLTPGASVRMAPDVDFSKQYLRAQVWIRVCA